MDNIKSKENIINSEKDYLKEAEGGIKVLMFSADHSILEGNTAVRNRMIEYGTLVKELHIVIFSRKNENFGPIDISPNVWIYPTSSRFKILRSFGAKKIGKKIVRERNFVRGNALITAQDPFETGLAGFRLKKSVRLPLEIQIHTDLFSPEFKKTYFLNRIRTIVANFVIKRADHLRAVSGRIKDSVTSRLSVPLSKISILPIYVDTVKIAEEKSAFELHTRYPQFDFIIAMASRLVREKNISMALSVFQEVVKKFPRTGLIIVGDGPEKNSLLAEMDKLSLSGNVVFEGWKNVLTPYLKTADIFLSTSRYEGYGMSLLEAAASGSAIVASDAGIAGSILIGGENAFICKSTDKESYVRSIIELMENSEKRIQFKMKAQKSAISAMPSRSDYLAQLKKIWQTEAVLR